MSLHSERTQYQWGSQRHYRYDNLTNTYESCLESTIRQEKEGWSHPCLQCRMSVCLPLSLEESPLMRSSIRLRTSSLHLENTSPASDALQGTNFQYCRNHSPHPSQQKPRRYMVPTYDSNVGVSSLVLAPLSHVHQ